MRKSRMGIRIVSISGRQPEKASQSVEFPEEDTPNKPTAIGMWSEKVPWIRIELWCVCMRGWPEIRLG